MINESQIRQALVKVEDPELGRDIVSLGMIREVSVQPAGEQADVAFTLALTTASCPMRGQLVQQARSAVQALEGVGQVSVNVTEMNAEERQKLGDLLRDRRPHARRATKNQVRHIVAVGSGKGGVGKSTVTALLAVSLRRQGHSVGVLDADITGPSLPRMFFQKQPRIETCEEGVLPALTATGIKLISINLLLPSEDEAVIWRGPLISGAIRQFWQEVVWGDLDYLLVDLPPGTSDAALTVMQSLPLNGVVLVTSPQALAAMVVRKAAAMAQRMNVPVVGIVENMSYVVCGRCQEKMEVFGPSHSPELALTLRTELLGQLPLRPELATYADGGRIEEYPGEEFAPVAKRLLELLPEEQRPPPMPGS